MAAEKLRALEEIIGAMPGAVVAYSGGADSAFVAEVSHRLLGSLSLAVTADSPSLPRRELRAARGLARERGWRFQVVSTSELEDERYASNASDRCYWCKSALFDVLTPEALRLGWPVLLGTNLDDLGDWRPGLRASDERGARHPLVEAGFTKGDVRRASSEMGLPTHDKPASACLSSRFAYGVRVTADGLRRVEAAEEWMLDRDYRVVRVRDLGGDSARVEVGSDEVGRLLEESGSVRDALRSLGFASVVIDEEGYRSGRLNEPLVLKIEKGRLS